MPIITLFGIIALVVLTAWSITLINQIEVTEAVNISTVLQLLQSIKDCLETVVKPALVLLQTCVDDIKTKVTQLVTTDIPLIQECLDIIKNSLIPAIVMILDNIFAQTTIIHDKTVAQMATWPAPQCDDSNNCTSDIFRFGGCMHKPVPDLTPCNDTACFTGGYPHCHGGECQDITCLGNCDFVGFLRKVARRARSGARGREVITTTTGTGFTTTMDPTTTPAPEECPVIMFRPFLACNCWKECSPDNFCKYFCTHRDGADSIEHLSRDCGHNEAMRKVCLDMIDPAEPLKECLNVNVHCPADSAHFDDKKKKKEKEKELESKEARSFTFEQQIICQYHFRCVTPLVHDDELCGP